MASNLACIGLSVASKDELEALLRATLETSREIGRRRDLSVRLWQDPSGARLVLGVRDGAVVDLLPSFAGTAGADLADLGYATDEVVVASVVDPAGQTVTRLAMEVEERLLAPRRTADSGRAVVVALGTAVTVHDDDESFARSAASLLDPAHEGQPPPPDRGGRALPWPPRLAAESFIPRGMFAREGGVTADAVLHGTVLVARKVEVEATGQHFVAARVRTIGLEVDLCIPASATSPVPGPGCVVGGDVFLVGSVPSLLGPEPVREKRSWMPWRR